MQTLTSIEAVRTQISAAKKAGKTVAFVPTMGNLHRGHISLVEKAVAVADCVIASIFVNPMQFGAGEDLDNYPRTLQADQEKLIAAKCDYLFLPSDDIMYPNGREQHIQISAPEISDILCGAERPGHFTGVCTVVAKLFNIVQPDIAVFGNKDFQQLAIIRKMTTELNMPVSIIGLDTARAEDGLALSSRNGYLNAEQRAIAPALYRVINDIKNQIEQGNHEFLLLSNGGKVTLSDTGMSPGYLEILDSRTLGPITSATNQGVVLASASIGNTRLIDNVTFLLKGNDN